MTTRTYAILLTMFIGIPFGLTGYVTWSRAKPSPPIVAQDRFDFDAPPPVLKKTDMIRVVSTDKITPTEPVEKPTAEAPTKTPPIVLVYENDKPTTKHKRHVARHDVCSRHNMRKVKTGRYGWRCKR